MSRFLFLWLAISAIVYGFIFFLPWASKKTLGAQLWRIAVAAWLALIIVIPLFLINSISGV